MIYVKHTCTLRKLHHITIKSDVDKCFWEEHKCFMLLLFVYAIVMLTYKLHLEDMAWFTYFL